jgi:CRP-like cAMP-binding protein
MKPSSILNQLKQVLAVPPKDRTPALLNMLVAYTKDIEFFRTLVKENSPHAHFACCSCIKHEQFSANQQVFAAGDTGDKFYIILQGSVSVLNPLSKSMPVEFEEVNVLREGQSFGELALIRDDTRIASIVCIEETHFAVLAKHDFKRINGEVTERRLSEVVSFLRSLPMFAPMTKESLTKLSFYFRQRQFTRKQVVYREGEQADVVYFVKEGEFQLLKKVRLIDAKSYKRSVQKTTTSEVAILARGEILGEEDVLHDQPRNTTCVCYSTTAETYYISSTDFKSKINQDFFKYLQKRTDLKRTWRDNKINTSPSSFPIKALQKQMSLTPTPSLGHMTSVMQPQRSQTQASLRFLSPRRLLSPKDIIIESPTTKPSDKRPTKSLRRSKSLAEVMLEKMMQDNTPRGLKKQTSKFVNIHVKLMKTAHLACPLTKRLSTKLPMKKPSTKPPMTFLDSELSHPGDFLFRSLPSMSQSPSLRHYSTKTAKSRRRLTLGD